MSFNDPAPKRSVRVEVYLSVGSNMGDRERNINDALEAIRLMEGVELDAVSSLYRSEAVEMETGEWFLNCAACIVTALAPLELLDRLEAIERDLGRTGKGTYSPRTIDIDILLYGAKTISLPRLEVPHPRMTARRFVLEPLAELAPDAVPPRVLAAVASQEVVRQGAPAVLRPRQDA